MNLGGSFTFITFTIGMGLFGEILIRYALGKVLRIAAIVSGLFLAGLAYLQYQRIASINWDKLEQACNGVVRTFANVRTLIDTDLIGIRKFTLINGVPITSSMSIGFTIGFLKG